MRQYIMRYDEDTGAMIIADQSDSLAFVITARRLEHGLNQQSLAVMLDQLDETVRHQKMH